MFVPSIRALVGSACGHDPTNSSRMARQLLLCRRLFDFPEFGCRREVGPQGQGWRSGGQSVRASDDRTERGGRRHPPEGDAGDPDKAEEIKTWLTAPTTDALKLQRPLPDGSLKIVGRGMKKDENATV